ncbi:novel immune-type receptor 17 [Oryzias latipes]|uniref:Novel immune-type receptor 17 isoform 1 n=1 Tax=Oryzias latipes TaxID=8090 RepID=B3TZA6_ORYLA|nr:novel immune-type receptor 17 [Oryzias latipes]ACB86923.1 novel immune-type receptor 17 isoform 1 [Oryzias latipes]
MASIPCAIFLTVLFSGEMAQTKTSSLSSSLRHDTDFLTVKPGDNLSLKCFYEDVVDARFYWYKQSLGQKPKLISISYKYEDKGVFHGEFRNSSRFTLDNRKGNNHLMIANLHYSDSATYYCASSYLYNFEFSDGITVNVKGSDLTIQTSVDQSSSENIHAGDSVTLNCTVHTGSCDEEHRVYWFKDSEDSHPGLIYTHGGRNDQCERKNNTQTHSCVYELPIKNLTESHAGIYYCAVVSCGHILFGNGTKLDLTAEVPYQNYLWSGALFFTTLLCVFLGISLCLMTRSHNRKMSGSSQPPKGAMGFKSTEKVYHAAVCTNLANRSRRLRDPTRSECVYNSMKQ